jgi:DNA-binding SARP family transcriptional activator/tetratricopeptide (TPR) repeat protein
LQCTATGFSVPIARIEPVIADFVLFRRRNLAGGRFETSEMSQPLQFSLLGVPEMAWHGRSFSISRRQARALLFRLATDLQPVSREVLADLLWPETSPAAARRNLTRLLSYTRGALPRPELLLITETAIALQAGLVASDAVRFSELCAGSQPAGWAAAADLYRGRFLEGFVLAGNWAFDDWLSRHQHQIEHVYLETLRKLMAARVDEGANQQAIQIGQQYLLVDELAEDVHRRLITLYSAAGQRSSALRQFEWCTAVLERELGVPPLPETRAAYEAARDGVRPPAAAAEPPQPEWATLPGLDLPLVGREAALEQLERAHGRFRSGGAILISGEPGVGKSRLMKEYATAQTCLVLAGNSHPGGQDLPYQPLVQALRLALSYRERWHHVRPIWLAETARLLPELRDEFPDLPQPLEMEPAQAQPRLYEALAQLFRGLAAGGPLLLCLDDVHRADAATLGWLSYFAAGLSGSGVCILATYRIHRQEALADWRAALERRRLLADLRLGNLSPATVGRLMTEVSQLGQASTAQVERLYAATGGNAFFVLETIRELLESGRLADETAGPPLPNAVRDAVLRRAARLSPLAGQLLEMASVLAPLVTLEVLAGASGRDELAVAEGLQELLARHQLAAGEAGFAFLHDLGREAIYQNIPPWRRQLLHRRAGQALVAQPATRRKGVLAHIAGHFEAAGDLAEAVDYYRLAAEAAQGVVAHLEAASHFRRALACLPQEDDSAALAGRLQEQLGHSLSAGGQFPAAREAFSAALDLSGPDERERRALLWRALALTYGSQHQLEAMDQVLDKALEALGPEPESPTKGWQQAWLKILLSRMDFLYFRNEVDELARLVELVKPILDEVGEPRQRIDYLLRQGQLAVRQERFAVSEEGIDLAIAYLRAAEEFGQPDKIAYGHFSVGFRYLWAGRPAAANEMLQSGLSLAEQSGLTVVQLLCLTYLACNTRLLHDVAGCRAFAGRALALAGELDNANYVAVALANLAWADWRQEAHEIAMARARQALQNWGDHDYPIKWLAYWPLLAMAAKEEQWPAAVESAEAMLEFHQQKLPDAMEAALSAAVQSWREGQTAEMRGSFVAARRLAEESGHL